MLDDWQLVSQIVAVEIAGPCLLAALGLAVYLMERWTRPAGDPRR
jgi:hypothetical protein